MAEQLTDEQQEEQVKQWIKDNWLSIVAGLVLGFSGLFGWQYYQKVQREHNAAASSIYQQLTEALQKSDSAAIKSSAESILNNYRDTTYAEFAALARARVAIDAGDAEQAQYQYEWVITNGKQQAVKNVARLRLGRLLLSEGKVENVLTLLPTDSQSFAAEFAELKGDVLLAKGDIPGARDSYTAALALLPLDANARLSLQKKLDDIAQPEKSGREAAS